MLPLNDARDVLASRGAVLCAALAQDALPDLSRVIGLSKVAGAGIRLVGNPSLAPLLSQGSLLGDAAASLLGETAHPVRAILFDKTAEANWSLGWHQDRVVAVRERVETAGFGPWSIKQGIHHAVAPPELIARMVTLRIHLDPVGEGNGPLEVIEGSHALGRLAKEEVARIGEGQTPLTCFADAGDVWAYSTGIIHRSRPSRSVKARRVLHVDYSPDALPQPLKWRGLR